MLLSLSVAAVCFSKTLVTSRGHALVGNRRECSTVLGLVLVLWGRVGSLQGFDLNNSYFVIYYCTAVCKTYSIIFSISINIKQFWNHLPRTECYFPEWSSRLAVGGSYWVMSSWKMGWLGDELISGFFRFSHSGRMWLGIRQEPSAYYGFLIKSLHVV